MSVVSGWQSLSCREPTDSHCNTVILVFTVENVEGCVILMLGQYSLVGLCQRMTSLFVALRCSVLQLNCVRGDHFTAVSEV